MKFLKNNWLFFAIAAFSGVMSSFEDKLGFKGVVYIIIFSWLMGLVYLIILKKHKK